MYPDTHSRRKHGKHIVAARQEMFAKRACWPVSVYGWCLGLKKNRGAAVEVFDREHSVP